jgi:hypothetical protein
MSQNEEESETMICGICNIEKETRPECEICDKPSCSKCSIYTSCKSRICKPCYNTAGLLKPCPECKNSERLVRQNVNNICFDRLPWEKRKNVKLYSE